MGRNFFGLRALGLYLLAGAPVFLVALTVWVRMFGFFGDPPEPQPAGELSRDYSIFFGEVLARVVFFFVCLLVFTRLFRAEVQQRSLHYYFLAPVRRGVLVAGKFVAGFAAAGLLLSFVTASTYLLHFLPLTARRAPSDYPTFLTRRRRLRPPAGYVGVTLLGVLGYGAVFLAIGIFFRNPIVPALVVFGWEWANFLLPPALKRISVVHYLHALQPVPPPEGTLALLADPPSRLARGAGSARGLGGCVYSRRCACATPRSSTARSSSAAEVEVVEEGAQGFRVGRGAGVVPLDGVRQPFTGGFVRGFGLGPFDLLDLLHRLDRLDRLGLR